MLNEFNTTTKIQKSKNYFDGYCGGDNRTHGILCGILFNQAKSCHEAIRVCATKKICDYVNIQICPKFNEMLIPNIHDLQSANIPNFLENGYQLDQ